MADLRDNFADKEKDLSHLSPSVRKPAPQKSEPREQSVATGDQPYVRPNPSPPLPPETPLTEEKAETQPQSPRGSGGADQLQVSGQNRLRQLASERGQHGRLAEHSERQRLSGTLKRQIARRGTMAGCGVVAAEGIVVGIVGIMLFAAALSFTGPGGTDDALAGPTEGPLGICSISVGEPRTDGYVQQPADPAYDLNVNGGSPPEEQWGAPDLVKTTIAVAREWNRLHPNQRIGVGDLDAPNHDSHDKGEDVDIYSRDGLFPSLPGHAQNPNYRPALAEELAKLYFQIGNINLIGFTDTEVIGRVNAWAAEQKLSGQMTYWGGHDDHFHVRIHKGALAGICAAAASGPTDGEWNWPATGTITTPWGYVPSQRRTHEGLDIANNSGSPIWATRAGTVRIAGQMSGYGNVIIINHGDRESLYGHLLSFGVKVGDKVAAGQRIASMGSTGQSSGPHLHFELSKPGITLPATLPQTENPCLFLSAKAGCTK
jgi:hypothetical protein